MTWTLKETFNAPSGTWSYVAPWDSTEASESVKSFLTTQKHVDLRCFRNVSGTDPRPQSTLDPLPQTDLDSEIQTLMETQPAANIVNENWVLSGTGLAAITIGEIATRGGWSGLTTTTQASAVDATLTSSITTAIDISPGTKLSLIFPDYNTWDGDSYVQMTSDVAGAFGTGHDSAQVQFSANTAVMPELRLNVSAFAAGGFDNTKVRGIRIRLHHAVALGGGDAMTIMAIRSLDAAWAISWLDFDTRIGSICRPVTLDGLATTGTTAKAFEFVRGDGTKNDPIPADVSMNMFFYPGGLTSPNDATGGTVNYLAFLFREQKNIAGGTGNHIEAGLQFNDAGTTFIAKKISTTGGSPGTPTTTGSYSVSVGGPLDPTKRYLFSCQLKGTQIIPKIYEVNTDHSIVTIAWNGPGVTVSNAAYKYQNGRVGFIADLRSRDAYVDAIDISPTGFAELITETYSSRTPVDGAQLSAVFSSDLNLFTGMASGATPDSTKTISGNGSYRSTSQMVMDSFLVDDWTQMYLKLSIWVASAVTEKNQPEITLNGVEDSSVMLTLDTALLKAAQWNNLYFDLGLFRDLRSGVSYFFSIAPGATPDQPLGFYWVDSINIGRRRVSWSARATSGGLWREFKEMVNDSTGAIHFTPEERGRVFQLKADALTEDAWVASFNLFPRYAQLGLPLWDHGGVYENFDGGQ